MNNGIGNCIQAKLVDQEGGGAVGRSLPLVVTEYFCDMDANNFCTDLNPAAWSALTNSQDGQVAVEW